MAPSFDWNTLRGSFFRLSVTAYIYFLRKFIISFTASFLCCLPIRAASWSGARDEEFGYVDGTDLLLRYCIESFISSFNSFKCDSRNDSLSILMPSIDFYILYWNGLCRKEKFKIYIFILFIRVLIYNFKLTLLSYLIIFILN